MEHVEAARSDHSVSARGETFTGQVWAEAKLAEPGVKMNRVTFGPNARTFWHRHEKGQVLAIVSGQGFVGTRSGEVILAAAGDTVWAPPGEEHYHGATDDSIMVHDAVSLGVTEWLDEVPEEEYGKDPQ